MRKSDYANVPATGTPVVPLAAVRVTVAGARASGNCAVYLKETRFPSSERVVLKGNEGYVGSITWLVVIVVVLLFWPAMCVPCCIGLDRRDVYLVTNTDGSTFEVDCHGNLLSERRCCGTRM